MATSKATAAKIKAKRLQLNYSQDYIAGILSISQNAYSKIELGYSKISVDRLGEIAEIFNVEPKTLLS